MAISNKTNYIRLVCNKTGKNYFQARKTMNKAASDFGVTFREYYDFEMYNMSFAEQTVAARKIMTRRELKSNRMAKIIRDTGFTSKQVYDELRKINAKKIYNITVYLYSKYEIYRYKGEELDEFLNLMVKRNQLKDDLLEKFEQIDNGVLSYEDVKPLLADFYAIIERMVPASMYDDVAKIIIPCYPELENDEDELKRITIDLESIRVLLEFTQLEYLTHHFAEKDIEEKRKFISDKERLQVLETINDPSKYEILDDKFQAYEILKDHYYREVIEINSSKDYEKFKELCDKNEKLVTKSRYDTMGRGVALIEVPESNKVKELFDKLLSEYKSFIVEELIVAHDTIKALNPDSVNTVRVVTYFDGNKSIVHDSFMKVGQKGSFVDNGGAGGIFVSVDHLTGCLDSNGVDETGIRYEKHPYTGVTFNGYQLPDWEAARALCLEIADTIPGLNYIGWDITYTADNRWIIVEGNAKTQFLGQQCTTNTGVKEDLFKTVGYKK